MINLTELGINKQKFTNTKVSHNYLGNREENGGTNRENGGDEWEEINGGNKGIGKNGGRNGGEHRKENKGEYKRKHRRETVKDWEGGEKSIKCRYGGEIRLIHPAVCEWHRKEKDEICRKSRCPRMSLGWG